MKNKEIVILQNTTPQSGKGQETVHTILDALLVSSITSQDMALLMVGAQSFLGAATYVVTLNVANTNARSVENRCKSVPLREKTILQYDEGLLFFKDIALLPKVQAVMTQHANIYQNIVKSLLEVLFNTKTYSCDFNAGTVTVSSTSIDEFCKQKDSFSFSKAFDIVQYNLPSEITDKYIISQQLQTKDHQEIDMLYETLKNQPEKLLQTFHPQIPYTKLIGSGTYSELRNHVQTVTGCDKNTWKIHHLPRDILTILDKHHVPAKSIKEAVQNTQERTSDLFRTA